MKILCFCNEIEFTIVIYKIKVTFIISKQNHAFSPSFKIDANYSVYSFNATAPCNVVLKVAHYASTFKSEHHAILLKKFHKTNKLTNKHKKTKSCE